MEKKLWFSSIIHGGAQTSFWNFHVDDEVSDSKKNVDEKLRFFSIVIHKTQMTKKTLKTLDNNSGI